MDQAMVDFLNGPEFLSLAPAKQKFLREMVTMMEGRQLNEKVQIILSYGFRMQNQGLTLTAQESSMLMNVLQQGLSQEEKARFEQIARMF